MPATDTPPVAAPLRRPHFRFSMDTPRTMGGCAEATVEYPEAYPEYPHATVEYPQAYPEYPHATVECPETSAEYPRTTGGCSPDTNGRSAYSKGRPEAARGPPEAVKGTPEASRGSPEASSGVGFPSEDAQNKQFAHETPRNDKNHKTTRNHNTNDIKPWQSSNGGWAGTLGINSDSSGEAMPQHHHTK